MAHEIEQFSNGEAAFFSAREPAWHRLGKVTEEALTAKDALAEASLDWSVELHPVYILGSDGENVKVEDKKATVRQNPETSKNEPLGVVGSRYTPIQNKEAFQLLDDIVDESGAHYESAGSLRNGRRVFMTMKLPDSIQFGDGQDTIDKYLMATTSHDGSGSLKVAVTPVRTVCMNTLRIALSSAPAIYSVRHTTNASKRLQEARRVLGISFKYLDSFQEEMEKLLAVPMSGGQFSDFVDELFPLDEEQATAHARTQAEIRRNGVKELWNAPTQQNVEDTAYAAFQAVVEWADWFAPVHAKASEKEEQRALRVVEGRADAVKNKAFALLN